MLSKKLSRLLFEISKNSRISTKNLGRKLRVSQQSASYLLLSSIKKGYIQDYHTLIDPAMFGLTNILVLFNYRSFEREAIASIKDWLIKNPYCTMIEESTLNADLIVQYTVPNLSLFNKENQSFIHKFKNFVQHIASYPIIVKHIYSRKYLHTRANSEEWILSGDRNVISFKEKEKRLIKELKKDAKISMLELSKNIGTEPKTAVKIKKDLEKNKVLRQYSVVLNYELLEIRRERILLQLDTESKREMDRFLQFCKIHPNILTAFKIIGKYDLIITIERTEEKDILSELRKNFKIEGYRFFDIKNILKSETVPDNVLNDE